MRPKISRRYHEDQPIEVTMVPNRGLSARRTPRGTEQIHRKTKSSESLRNLGGRQSVGAETNYQKMKTTAFPAVNSKHLQTPLERGAWGNDFVP